MVVFCKANSDCSGSDLAFCTCYAEIGIIDICQQYSWFGLVSPGICNLEQAVCITLNAFLLSFTSSSGLCSAVLHVTLELRQHSTDWLVFITRFSKCSAPITVQHIFRSGQPSAMVITVRAKFSTALGILPQIWSQAWVHSAFLQESQPRLWESPNSVPDRGVPTERCAAKMKVAGKCLSHMVMLVCDTRGAREGQKK